MGRSGHPARWAGTTPMCPPGAVRRWPGPLLLLAWLWRWLWLPTGLLLAATGAAQAATYTSASTPYSWVDPGGHAKIGHNTSPYKFTSAGCGSAPPTLDDAISGLIPIGFSFVFGGSPYTHLRLRHGRHRSTADLSLRLPRRRDEHHDEGVRRGPRPHQPGRRA